MEITLGQIGTWLAFIVTFVGGIEFIVARINKVLDKKLEPIQEELRNSIIENLKTDLVNYQQIAKLGKISETQKEDYYCKLDRYTNMGLNSYIHKGHEELIKEGKI